MDNHRSAHDAIDNSLTIGLTQNQLNCFNPDIMETISRTTKIMKLTLSNHDTNDPDDKGHILMIDSEIDKVVHCCGLILDEITRFDERETIQIALILAERDIYQAFGRDPARVFDRLSDSSRTQIAPLQNSSSPDSKKLCITGTQQGLKQAISEIFRTLMRNRLPPVEQSTSINLIIPDGCAAYILGTDNSFTKGLFEAYSVKGRVIKTNEDPCSPTESILVR